MATQQMAAANEEPPLAMGSQSGGPQLRTQQMRTPVNLAGVDWEASLRGQLRGAPPHQIDRAVQQVRNAMQSGGGMLAAETGPSPGPGRRVLPAAAAAARPSPADLDKRIQDMVAAATESGKKRMASGKKPAARKPAQVQPEEDYESAEVRNTTLICGHVLCGHRCGVRDIDAG
jgi:hypothetical protein